MRIRVNGVNLFFDVDGAKLVPVGAEMRERPTLILIHGGPGYDHSGFKPQFARLTKVAQVIYLDLRGNGRSARGNASQWTLSQWAADVHDFCEVLEITRPIVLGASFGGEVAMRYAIDFPHHPAGLILMSATARLRLDRSLAMFERLGGPAARDAAAAYWKTATQQTQAEYFRLCVPLYSARPVDTAEARRRAVVQPDVALHYNGGEALSVNLLPELGRVKCPTIVLVGANDPITTAEDADDIFQALPQGRASLHRLEGCGHLPFRDKPDSVFPVLETFIQERATAELS